MILDITRTLSDSIAVWPGDNRVRLTHGTFMDALGSPSTGSLFTSLHAGTHLDAPAHLSPDGPGVDRVPLGSCLGEALVVDCGEETRIDQSLLVTKVPEGTRRLLLRTRASARPDDAWMESWPAPTLDAARWLLERGIWLVGLDSPSIDAADSMDLPVHRQLLDAGVVVLENLALEDVTPGIWELIALPLRLEGMDGSPVRAVLRSREPQGPGQAAVRPRSGRGRASVRPR